MSAETPISTAEPGEARQRGTGLVAGVAAWSFCRCPPGDLSALRRSPGPAFEGGGRGGSSVLRQSDEQTVAGVSAVLSTLGAMGGGASRFAGWGVICGSRHLGRANVADALTKFGQEGVWGISPHLIPHFALHAPSGTISLALGLRGPTLGVGGGDRSEAEAFLTALSWLASGVVPGVWVVLSAPSSAPASTPCEALALALVKPDAGHPASIRVTAASGPIKGRGLSLERLDEALGGREPRVLAADPSGTLAVELIPGDAGGRP